MLFLSDVLTHSLGISRRQPLTQIIEALFNRGNMALLKLVASHLDLETSLFCPVTVDWPMVRQLTNSAGDKSPCSLREDARVALQRRTERAMQAADLCYTDAETGKQVPWLEDEVPKADPRKKNSLCRVKWLMESLRLDLAR